MRKSLKRLAGGLPVSAGAGAVGFLFIASIACLGSATARGLGGHGPEVVFGWLAGCGGCAAGAGFICWLYAWKSGV